MKRLREIGQKERRKTGKRWMAIALALSFLVIGGGAQGRVNAAPAVDAALPSESTAPSVGTQVPAAGIPMQAVVPVHVRTGPGVQWPSIGVLTQGQLVSVLASCLNRKHRRACQRKYCADKI